MSEERGKTMTNVNRIVAENNKVVRYINGNSIAETYAKQEAHSAGVYISLAVIQLAVTDSEVAFLLRPELLTS